MTDYDVAVIGGGATGAYAAGLLAGHGLVTGLFEKLEPADVMPVCTGVVGLPYLGLVDAARSVVVSEAHSVLFVAPSGHTMRVQAAQAQAWILDRTALELELTRRAGACGADVHAGCIVQGIAWLADGVRITVRRESREEQYSARAIVVASGVNPSVTEALGLGSTNRHLVGSHAEVEIDGLPETEIYLMQHAERGAFAWLVPTGEGYARAGALSCHGAGPPLLGLLERPDVKRRLRRQSTEVARRPIPVAPLPRGYDDSVVVVGDALGVAKPTTGGGLYFGALTARSAVDALVRGFERGDLSAYALAVHDRAWKHQLAAELRRGRMLRRIYSHMSPGFVDRIITGAARADVAGRLLSGSGFSFDQHTSVLVRGLIAGLGASLLPAPMRRRSRQ
ncbi:MAG: NAD(P)/FAD-dependent oxidoreductase [Chloroflexota bacterium]